MGSIAVARWRRSNWPCRILVALSFCFGCTILEAGPQAWSQDWIIDADSSLVAVVTHKEGLASGLAHEHLIAAPLDAIDLRLDSADPQRAQVLVEFEVVDLLVDEPALQEAWQQDLLDSGLLAAPFAELKPKDRRKIRASMLGRKQLDAQSFPRIEAVVDGVRVDGTEATMQLTLTVRDRAVQRDVRLPWPAVAREELRVAFVARFQFTEFGIRPYSALLGAIRVADAFDVVVRLVATKDRASL